MSLSTPPADRLGQLLPLVGEWSGTARVTPPGRNPIELRHTEQVTTRAGGTILTIEGVSYPAEGGGEPVFSAFAVVCADEDGLRWHAYSRGQYLDTELAVAAGRFAWSTPSEPATRYDAEFDHDHWHETGRLGLPGDPVVFTMDLTRA